MALIIGNFTPAQFFYTSAICAVCDKFHVCTTYKENTTNWYIFRYFVVKTSTKRCPGLLIKSKWRETSFVNVKNCHKHICSQRLGYSSNKIEFQLEIESDLLIWWHPNKISDISPNPYSSTNLLMSLTFVDRSTKHFLQISKVPQIVSIIFIW